MYMTRSTAIIITIIVTIHILLFNKTLPSDKVPSFSTVLPLAVIVFDVSLSL